MLFLDINGDSLWVHYGNNQRVFYENGNLYTINGNKYKGKDAFVNAVYKILQDMDGTKTGAKMISELTQSSNSFDFKNTKSSAGNRSFSFSGYLNGGGEVKAAALLNPQIQQGQKLESVAHELFHGYQHEFGDNGAYIHREVEALLVGKAIAMQAGYGIQNSFGTNSNAGRVFDGAMNSLFFGNNYNNNAFQTAVRTFKSGSIANQAGTYNHYGTLPNQTNPILRWKKLFPLF